MEELIVKLQAHQTISKRIVELDEDRVVVRQPNGYGLSIAQDEDASGYVKGRYSVCPVKIDAHGQLTFGHHIDILEYYQYTDCTYERVLELFEEVGKLNAKNTV